MIQCYIIQQYKTIFLDASICSALSNKVFEILPPGHYSCMNNDQIRREHHYIVVELKLELSVKHLHFCVFHLLHACCTFTSFLVPLAA